MVLDEDEPAPSPPPVITIQDPVIKNLKVKEAVKRVSDLLFPLSY
jgi:hypothetical protein